ncbi:MAG: aminoacetone oxidase family FAD-binding enzyme [Phycisphaeraceae bacterium]|nr:aminoacetone oxidase family FAD-binding enzyme [Phycisphaeraceae bacterium]MBX3368412.1 aminoacetone oxidase family FAD-binding enzyme [Phycisphaeraceae bacterium]
MSPSQHPTPPRTPAEPIDIAVIGAGAAGLMAAISAGRTARDHNHPLTIIALDGARTLGAKILVAGGGRCNVTHHAVDESAYAGSSRNAIKKVLRSFPVERTIDFFRERGVELKREDTGKLFPTTDSARTILNALLDAARDAGVQIRHPWRVGSITRDDAGLFHIASEPSASESESDSPADSLLARRIILATGGRSLPKSGSDGKGYDFARALGHTITPRVFPALVPLIVPEDCFIRSLSGLAAVVTLEVRASTNKRLAQFTNSTLCTHFGLSGPGPLDISRYLTAARHDDPGAWLAINWLPDIPAAEIDAALQNLGRSTPIRLLCDRLPARLPERLAEAICKEAGVAPGVSGNALTRDARRSLVTALTEMRIPITGDRGYTYAEVTAGGVPLSEIKLDTMESRTCPGLHLSGEICDVDGRIGGFNFQWAWASGYLAGRGAALKREP